MSTLLLTSVQIPVAKANVLSRSSSNPSEAAGTPGTAGTGGAAGGSGSGARIDAAPSTVTSDAAAPGATPGATVRTAAGAGFANATRTPARSWAASKARVDGASAGKGTFPPDPARYARVTGRAATKAMTSRKDRSSPVSSW